MQNKNNQTSMLSSTVNSHYHQLLPICVQQALKEVVSKQPAQPTRRNKALTLLAIDDICRQARREHSNYFRKDVRA